MASAATLVQPTGEMWKQIRIDLNENVNTRDRDLAIIKEWLKKQPHLPDEWSDTCLMSFLRGCSFSLEKAKRKLDMYFTMRAACPEFFTNRDVDRPELDDLLKRAQGAPLPGLTPKGRRVTFCRATTNTIDAHYLNNAFKVAMMYGDVRLMEESEGIGGDVFILDASVVSPSHLAKISISHVKKFFICVQEAYPVKLKEVHVVNVSPIIDAVITMVKPFLKDKIKKRIFVHSDLKTLYDYVPQKMLPEEYGGSSGLSLDEINNAWIEKLRSYKQWFKEQESMIANEALRPGKPTNYDELFGIDGSFRQLRID
ncbi:alpha-tocopherol transfer protein-like [Hyposmocoma kahamanoa]|uniref:alpha-tocopherol transfer protein-like n=1 Tax=Hyposmocoma kahamanoa TaxID=1477025 RepID=UPI000E6D6F87|nr:alpha-tocopherol transfer protein-like [Hyposmocoma kahamanoa]XP_026333814.1 alpha-tocopherol transfer protein-like [Hyposmocoma kahamanoa]